MKLAEDVGEQIQNNFLADEKVKKMPDLLHYYLSLVRCLSASYGDESISMTRWLEMRILDDERSKQANFASSMKP